MNDINNPGTATQHETPRQVAVSGDVTQPDTAEINQHPNVQSPHIDMDASATQTNDDASRYIMANRDEPGHGATQPDMPGHAEVDRDTPRHLVGDNYQKLDGNLKQTLEDQFNNSNFQQNQETDGATQTIADWVDIETTDEILREHGIARTIRTIQRMCQQGKLVARLVPTENGVRYLIERGSIHEFIDRHNQIMPSGKGDDDNLDVSSNLTSQNAVNSLETTQSHMQEVLSMKDEQIEFFKEQLSVANAQLQVKDEQINTMLERDHETNVLIQNLQQLMGLPAAMGRNPNDKPSDLTN